MPLFLQICKAGCSFVREADKRTVPRQLIVNEGIAVLLLSVQKAIQPRLRAAHACFPEIPASCLCQTQHYLARHMQTDMNAVRQKARAGLTEANTWKVSEWHCLKISLRR